MPTARRISQTEFLALFDTFPKTQQTKIVQLLNDRLFADQFEALERDLPDVEMSDEEIMKEVRAVRYGKSASSSQASSYRIAAITVSGKSRPKRQLSAGTFKGGQGRLPGDG